MCELSRNLNSINNNNNQSQTEQKSLVTSSNKLLEPTTEIKDDNVTEVETKIEINLGFAKISRIIKVKTK